MQRFALFSSFAIAGLSLIAFATPNSAGDSACSASSTSALSGEKNIIETAVAAGNFNTLATALRSAELVETLSGKGPFTVFAPTDAAFAKIPAETLRTLLEPESRSTLTNILTFHVVAGNVTAADVMKLKNATALNGQRIAVRAGDEGVAVAGAKVTRTDIRCSNGVIHVIDAVMMPSTDDLIATAVKAGSFKTLAAALEAGKLVKALQGEGPFTVFAPTDAAFAALPEGTVANLLKPENKEQLAAILKYHVVSGRVYSDQLKDGAVKTLNGKEVRVSLKKAGAFINGAQVKTADIETTNGVIHVIDKVLLPE